MKGSARPSRGRVLRPAFEWILLIVSLVTGLGVIGACAVTGSGGAGAGLRRSQYSRGAGLRDCSCGGGLPSDDHEPRPSTVARALRG